MKQLIEVLFLLSGQAFQSFQEQDLLKGLI